MATCMFRWSSVWVCWCPCQNLALYVCVCVWKIFYALCGRICVLFIRDLCSPVRTFCYIRLVCVCISIHICMLQNVPGDEVLEWNGRKLKNLSFEQVCQIVNESKYEPQITLTVARKLTSVINVDLLRKNTAQLVCLYGLVVTSQSLKTHIYWDQT